MTAPLDLYGSNISYFTGKLENYFRVKGIEYRLHAMRFPGDARRIERDLGVFQMPVLQLPDGRWMTDSTKIIQWFEAEQPTPAVIPADPVVAFISLLLEDYADEWLWRPAMHYRWHYPEGAHFASRHLADEHLSAIPLPGPLKRAFMRHRQRSGYTVGDGITAENLDGVEAIFLRLLGQLQAIFEQRPFLMGERPGLADIGFSGPFFRHFALDPVPLEIIRQRAPAVLEWVARLWNTRLADCAAEAPQAVPDDIGPLLEEVGNSYLPYLNANAAAVAAGNKRFDVQVGGVAYRGARYSRYRVWCLAELRRQFEALPEAAGLKARALLERHGCWAPLWEQAELSLLPGQEEGLPFRASTKMVGTNERV
ncbi:MAG: glutathione S-transferase family protein [Halieaceae bacterium]|nr:glutathione S-transferase family protein [Halieaceae bacterium]